MSKCGPSISSGIALGVAVGEGMAVSVGGFGVSVGGGGTGVELGGCAVSVASVVIRMALGATGVFVETGTGAVVDSQPTKTNGKHTTNAISMRYLLISFPPLPREMASDPVGSIAAR
jgi:hypothetical protein